MRVFFDPSALVKRYVDEAGTTEVLEWCDRADELALAVAAVPELIAAFCRLRRERRITAAQYLRLKAELMGDLADALICELTPQVAAALACEADVFVSADTRQCAAARGAGLQVVVPG
jgi:uncharacterized protein